VDNTTQPVYGQIEGGFAFLAVGEGGSVFGGFVLLIGLNFAGGNEVIHDPTVTSDVTTDLQFSAPGALPPERSILGAVILGIVAIVAIALLAYLILTRRNKEEPPERPPASPPSPPEP